MPSRPVLVSAGGVVSGRPSRPDPTRPGPRDTSPSTRPPYVRGETSRRLSLWPERNQGVDRHKDAERFRELFTEDGCSLLASPKFRPPQNKTKSLLIASGPPNEVETLRMYINQTMSKQIGTTKKSRCYVTSRRSFRRSMIALLSSRPRGMLLIVICLPIPPNYVHHRSTVRRGVSVLSFASLSTSLPSR